MFFRKLRFYSRFLAAFIKKHLFLIIVSLFLGILSAVFLPSFFRSVFNRQILKIGIVGKYNLENIPLEITQNISQGLTVASDDGQIQPSLADSWEINNDGKEYIFSLKDNLYWHDGKKVVAKDINLNFSDVTTSFLSDKKIVFVLKEPFAPFLSVVSKPVFKKGVIGTGDYRIKKIARNGQTIEKILIQPVKSKEDLPNLLYIFYPTEESARNAFKIGSVDILKDISNDGGLKNWKNVKTEQNIKINRYVAVYLNTEDKYLGDKKTRQALAYGIRKDWPSRALNSLNPKSWAYNSLVKPYDYDLDKAKKLLQESDNPNEKKEVLQEIELSVIPSLIDTAEKIKNDWNQLGIKTKIKITNVLPDNYQALLLAQEIPLDPDQYLLWHSTQELNITRYKSPKIDKLLEDGRKTLDQEKRKEIYLDFQKFLVEETPAIFLFHPLSETLIRK